VTSGALQGRSGLAFRNIGLVYTRANNIHRWGFHDSTNYTAPTDGAFFEILDLACTAKCRNNSSESAAGSSVTLTNGVWYVFDIDYTANDTVRFVVSELVSGTKVYDVTVSGANVPNTTSRTFTAALNSTYTTGGASAMADIAYIGTGPARPPYCPVPA
jgi:hypothetical protein